MSLQNQISIFLTLALFSIQISANAYVPCLTTFRGCPSNFTCSFDGKFCEKENDLNSTVRSSWSLLTNKCLDGIICGEDEYCLDYRTKNEKCVTNKISTCDTYLTLLSKPTCNNYFALLDGFETCSDIFLQTTSFEYKENGRLLLSGPEICMNWKMFDKIQEKDTCFGLEKETVSFYSECYANFGGCLKEENWPLLFAIVQFFGENSTAGFGKDFAKRCNNKYLNTYSKTLEMSMVQGIAKNLTDTILETFGVNTTDVFENLMEIESEKYEDSWRSNPDSTIDLLIATDLKKFLSTYNYDSPTSKLHPENEFMSDLFSPHDTPVPQQKTSSNFHLSKSAMFIIAILILKLFIFLIYYIDCDKPNNESCLSCFNKPDSVV